MKQLILPVLIIGVLVLAGCNSQAPNTTDQSESKLQVATTFYPLYEATKMVTGDDAEVFSIVPLGTEPHSFEPAPQDILKLNKANAFVTMGIEFEEFEEDLIDSVANDVTIIPAGKGITLLEFEEHKHEDEHEEDEHGHHEEGEHEEDHHEEDEHGHHEEDGHEEDHEEDEHGHAHGGQDPHIWLSPNNMKVMVDNIKTSLVQIDSQNEAVYEQNAQQSTDQLSQLDQEFKNGLSNCEQDVVLVNHDAFSYLGRDYGFEVISIAGLSPESEPTPQQIKELIDEAEEHGLKYIFYEELVDPRISQTIASEVGAETLELSPVGGEGEDYFSLMRDNLANLKIAMACS